MAAPFPHVGAGQSSVSMERARLYHGARPSAWRHDTRHVGLHRFGSGKSALSAAALLGAAVARTTAGGYGRHWDRFVQFCKTERVSFLPATPETVACYLGHLFAGTRVAGGSIRQYLAPISHRHIQYGYVPPPTEAPVVGLVKSGYRRADHGRRGPRIRHVALPCAVPYAALRRLMHPAMVVWGRAEFGDAEVVAGMQLMARPSSVRALHSSDISFDTAASRVVVRLRVFKGDDKGFSPTRIVAIPFDGTADIVYRFWSRLRTAAHGALFRTAPPLAHSLARAVARAKVVAPPGCAYRGKSLRSGGISAANAVRVPLPNIMAVSGHTSVTTVLKHYLDVTVPPCTGARVFFSRLSRSS